MKIMHDKTFKYTPFSISTEQVENSPGTWASTKVSIFRDDMLIGEYLRNYSSYGTHTFYPFQVDNEWYALYSASYTATRVMKLHEDRIEDWCGEDPHSNGFCPVEYYIPAYVHVKDSYSIDDEKKEFDSYCVDCDYSEEDLDIEINSSGFIKLENCNFGFLCGCVWGDDTSWKMRYMDLSKVPEKILEITDKFGYCELPRELTLRECVHMDSWEPGHSWIRITKAESHNFVTGETY
jgi:hypothetical protein